MKTLQRFILSLAAAALWTTAAAAQQPPDPPLGGQFIALCKSPNQAGRNACGGVVASLMDAHVEMARRDPEARIICPPRRLNPDDARRVFAQWAAGTPGAAAMRFPALVMTALRARYPCAIFRPPK